MRILLCSLVCALLVTGVSLSASAQCLSNSDCDDADACTSNICDGQGNCTYPAVPREDCCNVDADCFETDNDLCTKPACDAANTCTEKAIVCDDGNACTTDSCASGSGACQFAPIANCCLSNAACSENDNDLCTKPTCNTTTQRCEEIAVVCDDADACTADACETDGACSHTEIAGCRDAGVPGVPDAGVTDAAATDMDTGGTKMDAGGADTGTRDASADTGPAKVDKDGDGYAADEDCDDTDPAINPGAEEINGDGLDNNCDGSIDEGKKCGCALDGSGGTTNLVGLGLLALLVTLRRRHRSSI